MNLTAELFPLAWHLAAVLGSVGVAVWVGWTAPWRRLADEHQLHAVLAAAVALTLLWSMKAGVYPGLNLHLLGAMACTLIFGPQLALLVLALALAGVTLNGSLAWDAYAVNFLLMAVFPVFIGRAFFRLMEHRLPHHFFVYIFINAFIGAAFVVLCEGALASLCLYTAGAYPAELLLSDYLPFFLLLGFSEAWISGMVLTVLVVYYPEWVSSFDDSSYLSKK